MCFPAMPIGDGTVNANDLTMVGQHSAQSGVLGGDFNGDGVVNLSDLTLLGQDWHASLPSAEPVAGSFPADALLVAASVPTAVTNESAISVTPVTTVGTPATSTSNSTADVATIAFPGEVASGQVAVPATSSAAAAAVQAMVIASSSVATSQPAYLVNESQPTASCRCQPRFLPANPRLLPPRHRPPRLAPRSHLPTSSRSSVKRLPAGLAPA